MDPVSGRHCPWFILSDPWSSMSQEITKFVPHVVSLRLAGQRLTHWTEEDFISTVIKKRFLASSGSGRHVPTLYCKWLEISFRHSQKMPMGENPWRTVSFPYPPSQFLMRRGVFRGAHGSCTIYERFG